jgi:hypothetical protein
MKKRLGATGQAEPEQSNRDSPQQCHESPRPAILRSPCTVRPSCRLPSQRAKAQQGIFMSAEDRQGSALSDHVHEQLDVTPGRA